MKSKKLLDEFTEYCVEHPTERFFQALRNFMGVPFLMICNDKECPTRKGMRDTFYIENIER